MKFEDLHIEDQMEQLFQSARTQAPKYAYSDASKMLTTGLALGATTVGHAKLLSSSLFKSKLIIMSVSAVIVTSAVLVYSVTSNSEKESLNELSPTNKVEVAIPSPISNEEQRSETIAFNSILPSEAIPNLLDNSESNVEINPPNSVKSTPSVDVYTQPRTLFVKTNRQIRFTITERTTLEELNFIKEKAKEAGLTLSHSVKIRNNAIRTLNLTIRDENGSLINRYTAGKSLRQSPFSFDLGWSVDESGKFLGFVEPEIELESDENIELLFLQDSTMAAEDQVRLEELMSLMDPELKTLDSLSEITNQFVEIITFKNEEFMKHVETQDKLYQKLSRLETREAENNKPSEKRNEEIKALKIEIESVEVIMKELESEMTLSEGQLSMIDLEMEKVLNRLDQLDALIQNPDQLEMLSDSVLSHFDEIQILEKAEINGSDQADQPSDENLITKSYLISPSTTETELQAIQKEALDAGISFSFNAKFKNDKLVFVDINMVINESNGKKHKRALTIGVKRKETFSEPIIWRQDEEGKAIDFGE